MSKWYEKLKELRAAPDEVLIAEHDRYAANTVVGTAYYTDELRPDALRVSFGWPPGARR